MSDSGQSSGSATFIARLVLIAVVAWWTVRLAAGGIVAAVILVANTLNIELDLADSSDHNVAVSGYILCMRVNETGL